MEPGNQVPVLSATSDDIRERAKRLRSSKDGGEGKGTGTKPSEELKKLPAEGLLAALNDKMQEIFRIVRTIRSIVWEIFLIALTVHTIWLIVQGLKPLGVVAVALMGLFS